jgi:hypothetical protein
MGGLTSELWIWVVVLAAVMGVGVYVLEKLRHLSVSSRSMPQEWLTQFREMHSQGVLSDQEFRTIKTALTPKVQQEINNDKTAE